MDARNKLAVALKIFWLCILLGMALANAWIHSWYFVFWAAILVFNLGEIYKNHLNITIINKVYNVDANGLDKQ